MSETQANDSIDQIENVSAGVANSLTEYETIEELAHADFDAVHDVLADLYDFSRTDTARIINEARAIEGVDQMIDIETDSEAEVVGDEESIQTEIQPEDEPTDELMSPEEFVEAGDEAENPRENFLIIAGDGVCDHDGIHSDKGPGKLDGLVSARLFELLGDECEEMKRATAIKSGQGWPMVRAWVDGIGDSPQRPDELRAPFSPNWDEFEETIPCLDDMRERAVEWADVLVVLENGDYVGLYISEANKAEATAIEAVSYNDESEDDVPDEFEDSE